MSHIRVLVCRVDDPHSDQMTELTAFDLPPADGTTLRPETALDELSRPPRRQEIPSSAACSKPNRTSSMLS
jgi:hypothetical protein